MFTSLSGSPAVRVLVFTLAHFLWQGVGIAGALAAVLFTLRRASATSRYLAACTALALVALAPVSTFWFLFTLLPDPAPGMGAPLAGPSPSSAGAPVTALVAALWLAGMLVMTARLIGGLVHLRGILRHHCTDLPRPWHDRLAGIAARLGIHRPVRLVGSAKISVPMVVGWLRPVIILPLVVLTSLPERDIEAILAHELAHVRRFDYLVNILQAVVEAALFYHPCVFWISRRVRVEREHCCDDAVVALYSDPIGYARALAELEAIRAHTPKLALASTGGALMVRIRRLVENESSRISSRRAWVAPVLLLGALAGLTLAGISACGRAADERLSVEPLSGKSAGGEPIAVEIPWLPPALDRWKPAIVATAARYGVDPAALAIVTLVESGGNPEARSPAGAVGLMQLMPATAARIAGERGLSDHSEQKLWDPAYNIDFGAYYFAQQLASFGRGKDSAQSIELAAAAYNSGPASLRKVLDGAAELPEETAHYKSLVAGMWNERNLDHSSTYDSWRQRIRARAAEKAENPLPGGRLTLPFGTQPQPRTGEPYFHEGIDLAREAGASIRAPLNAVVKSAADDGDRGNVVILDHGNGIETRFHHLGSVAVAPGQRISGGEMIGTVGTTGKTTGPHVHFEVRDNGEPLDPARYLGDTP